jgi:hypothetical protein
MLRATLIRRRVARLRAALLMRLPNWDDDPVAVRIARMWKRPTLAPDGSEIEDFARELPAAERAAAWVVCLGVPETPSIGDVRFEPEIIAPGHRWRELVPATFWTVVWVSLGFCCLGGMIVDLLGRTLANIVFYVAIVSSVTLMWLGQISLWPTYARLAPGIVQFLRYRPRRPKPRITSYPMTAGTIVVARNDIGWFSTRLAFTLVRGENVDELPITRFRNRARFTERTWQALLSTAPTPPLSDEELVG